MSAPRPAANQVRDFRVQRGWAQAELARRSGISRAAISAIEMRRLVPSVDSALGLARAFECTVEDLFGAAAPPPAERWAWLPAQEPCRFWRARVGSAVLRYPVEVAVGSFLPHDGVLQDGVEKFLGAGVPEKTLVLATCDPTAGLLAAEYERRTGSRLLLLQRSSRDALRLLRQGVVHVAGIHLAPAENHAGNAVAAKEVLGEGYAMVRSATWEEGLAVEPGLAGTSVRAILRARPRWIGREAGAGARQCQDEVLGDRTPRRHARNHWGVVEAIRSGWADVGVCPRLVSAQAGLRFVPVRQEAYELCYPAALHSDLRLRHLIDLLRSTALRQRFEGLPGYELSRQIEPRDL